MINLSPFYKYFLSSFKVFSQISTYLLTCEWASHNICYKLNIFPERTKHTDLNSDKPWWLNLVYLIIGSFYY